MREGLHFKDNIEPVFFGPSYFRVFKYESNVYALTNDGTPYQDLDADSPWPPRPDLILLTIYGKNIQTKSYSTLAGYLH